MTKSVLEFDEVAADDALIEAIRAGAGIEDVPSDDPAASLLVTLRDGVEPPAATPAPEARGVRRVVHHRRLMASGVAACVLVVAGVGSAVAGDPTAAFTYMFRQGVDLGSRFGSPAADENAQAPIGGGVEANRLSAGRSSTPLRQGSAAAPWVDDGVRAPLGYEHEPRHWNGQDPSDVGPYSADDLSTSDKDAAPDGHQPNQSAPTQSPELQDGDDPSSPPDNDGYGPQTEDPPDESEPPATNRPTESDPTDPTSPAPTEPTTPTPTEPTTPTDSAPTPTEPTTSAPTTTAPTTSAPTSSAPTGTPSSAPTSPESVPTP